MTSVSVRLSQIEDPRAREGIYTVGEIVFLVMAGVLAGQGDLVSIAQWGVFNEDWLRRYLPYANGTPSHDTLGRVLGRIKPGCVQAVFSDIVASIVSSLPQRDTQQERHIAVDGKSVRGSRQRESRAQHAVHAWDVGLQQLLGIRWVDGKTNEITVVPVLMDTLDLTGAVVTLDAMGAQLPLLTQIAEAGANAIVGLKGNQKTILEDTRLLFEKPPAGMSVSEHSQSEKSHGRLESRTTTVMGLSKAVLSGLHCKNWPVASVVRVASYRETLATGKASTEERFYLSTLPEETHPAGRQARLIRDHWSVENHLHGTLDVAFQEDDCRVREANAVKNLALLRRLAHVIVAHDTTKCSVKNKLMGFSTSTRQRDLILTRFAQSLEPKTTRVITARP